MPVLILFFLIADLLSFAFPFLAYYLYRQWNTYHDTVDHDYANRCLYGAIALLLLILLGRFLIKALLSRNRKGEEEPVMFDTKKRESIKRPDGSTINVEHYGREDRQAISTLR